MAYSQADNTRETFEETMSALANAAMGMNALRDIMIERARKSAINSPEEKAALAMARLASRIGALAGETADEARNAMREVI